MTAPIFSGANACFKVGTEGGRPSGFLRCERRRFTLALKPSFAVVRIGGRRANVSPEWQFMSIVESRNRYRQMIDEAVETVKARKAA